MNYYQLLNVSYNATTNEIQDAYYRILKRYELDEQNNQKVNDQTLALLKEAYETLIDPEKRIAYDKYLIDEDPLLFNQNYYPQRTLKLNEEQKTSITKQIKSLYTNALTISLLTTLFGVAGSILVIIAGFILVNNNVALDQGTPDQWNTDTVDYNYNNPTFWTLYGIGVAFLILWDLIMMCGFIIATVQITKMPQFLRDRKALFIMIIVGLVCSIVGLGIVSWILMITIAILTRRPERQFEKIPLQMVA